MVDNQHQKIKGYRDLTVDEIKMINDIKRTAESVGTLVDTLFEVAGPLDLDEQWLRIGRTDLKTGFMALVRAVAQPNSF